MQLRAVSDRGRRKSKRSGDFVQQSGGNPLWRTGGGGYQEMWRAKEP